MIDTNKYEETDHPELVEFEGETLGDTLTNLLAEVKRLRSILENAFKFVTRNDDVFDVMLSHFDHWSDINHMFDVTGHDECGCVDCCTAEVCPDCHACLEHYECQCIEGDD